MLPGYGKPLEKLPEHFHDEIQDILNNPTRCPKVDDTAT